MKCLPKQIKPLINDRGKTLVKVGNNRLVDNKIMFCFSFFNGSSIIEGDFNNYYASTSDATKAISDFFQTIKNISNYNANQFFSPAIKKQFHYNEFDDNEVIDRIENILINGYHFSREKVDEFERMYFEFSFSNGKRVIGTKLDSNVFEILFIDCNHMVCLNSSRFVKNKMNYSCPSLFEKINNGIESTELFGKDLLYMLIDAAKKGEYKSLEDFLKDYDELFNNE